MSEGTNVIALVPRPKPEGPQVHDGLVECLEKLLEEAKAGTLQGVVAFTWSADGNMHSISSGRWCRSDAFYAVEVFKAVELARCRDNTP